jgi:Flp pilus assembly secretin CpaC
LGLTEISFGNLRFTIAAYDWETVCVGQVAHFVRIEMKKFGLIALLASVTVPAFAGEPLTIQSDSSRLLTVASTPGTVVIGNPAIADVTMNGKQIFIHGRAFGETNLLIMDTAGNQIVNFDITVADSAANTVTLFRGTSRYSYSCAPNCGSVMMVGDANMEDIITQNGRKSLIATGKYTSEAAPPKPAQ